MRHGPVPSPAAPCPSSRRRETRTEPASPPARPCAAAVRTRAGREDRDQLVALAGNSHRNSQLLESVVNRRRKVLQECGAEAKIKVTDAPMALHLARATALENVALCLHSIYGFAYIPGSGIKGMTRA